MSELVSNKIHVELCVGAEERSRYIPISVSAGSSPAPSFQSFTRSFALQTLFFNASAGSSSLWLGLLSSHCLLRAADLLILSLTGSPTEDQ